MMSTRGVSPDVVTYNSLIDGLCNSGQWEEATRLFSEMIGRGISPDVRTFTILIDGMCKEGMDLESDGHRDQLTALAEYLNKARTLIYPPVLKECSDVKSDLIIYSIHLPYTDTNAFSLDLLEGVRRRIKEAEVAKNNRREADFTRLKMEREERIYQLLQARREERKAKRKMLFYLRSEEARKMKLEEEERARKQDGFEGVDCKWIRDQADDFKISELDLRNVLNNLLVAFAKLRDPDRAMFLLAMVQGQGLSVKTETLVAVVSALGNVGRTVEAEAVFEEMKEDCHCKLGRHDKANELLQEMNDSGCSPCSRTYNIMINSLGQQEKLDELKGLMEKMWSQGVIPNVIVYIILIYVYGQSRKFKDAIECLEVMKSTGFKAVSYNKSRLGQCICIKKKCLLDVECYHCNLSVLLFLVLNRLNIDHVSMVITIAQLTFGGVMFTNHFLLKNRVNKVIKDQVELTYLARETLKAQKLIKEIDTEGSN
ncbi:hypothetical protein GIB67_036840 [Kingdonia uniflora]|uniref:Pentatricopeptide repeat-containing protein n=1 Tax=Kingdonia uniflora TaxID=39325 RepID=A0A7J7LWT1_9MAGN|nr:hypothetical protein GIB67_036840 [Kingdonia uniflora]